VNAPQFGRGADLYARQALASFKIGRCTICCFVAFLQHLVYTLAAITKRKSS